MHQNSIPTASSDDFVLETAEHRFGRRQRQGLGLREVGVGGEVEDDPRVIPYSIQEGVWRPDGRGANQTIYSSFDWRGRKVRALKPVPKFRKGEQWSRPREENNDEFIGIMMGDSRMVGNQNLSSKFSGVKVGEAIDEEEGVARKYPLNYNPLMNMRSFTNGGNGGGKLSEKISGTDEETLRAMSTREQVLGLISQEGGGVTARPIPFAAMNIRNQTAGELEGYVTDQRVGEFLLDPDANDDYNTLAMGATPATMGINTSGDANTDGGDNMGADREMFVRGGGGGPRGDSRRAGASFSATLNPVKMSTKDLRGINQMADTVTATEFDPSDQIAPTVNTSLKSQTSTTKNLFNRNVRNPDLGFTDGSMDHDKSILTSSRRIRRKEQARGQESTSFASADQDLRDAPILAMSRNIRRKELTRPDPLSGTGNVDGIDPLGDFHVRNAAPKKNHSNRMLPLTAAILPEATLAADNTAAREQSILVEEPIQSVRGVRRRMESSQLGFGHMASTESEQFTMANRVDPAAPELLSRMTQQVDLRNRTTDLAAIGVINDAYSSDLKDAYSRDLAWMAPRMGKVGQKAIYESEDDANSEIDD